MKTKFILRAGKVVVCNKAAVSAMTVDVEVTEETLAGALYSQDLLNIVHQVVVVHMNTPKGYVDVTDVLGEFNGSIERFIYK